MEKLRYDAGIIDVMTLLNFIKSADLNKVCGSSLVSAPARFWFQSGSGFGSGSCFGSAISSSFYLFNFRFVHS